jgi:hypothetical protein
MLCRQYPAAIHAERRAALPVAIRQHRCVWLKAIQTGQDAIAARAVVEPWLDCAAVVADATALANVAKPEAVALACHHQAHPISKRVQVASRIFRLLVAEMR